MEPTSQTAAAAATGTLFIAGGIFFILVIIAFVCWLKVLIALFKKEGAGLGILGILCSIYAFIWGWMKSTELGLKKTMVWWTIAIVAMIGVWFVAIAGAVGMAATSPEFKKAIEDAQKKAQEEQVQPAPAPTTN
jgi:hypothetical protein